MSFASPFPEVDIPSTSVYEFLFGGIEDADLDRVALIDAKSGRETTYRELIGRIDAFAGALAGRGIGVGDVVDRKSTRLNSSHPSISYAVFCLKKKKNKKCGSDLGRQEA